jgi:hypothetical protein
MGRYGRDDAPQGPGQGVNAPQNAQAKSFAGLDHLRDQEGRKRKQRGVSLEMVIASPCFFVRVWAWYLVPPINNKQHSRSKKMSEFELGLGANGDALM